MKLSGVYTALITPFNGENIDEDGLSANIRFQIENGIDGLVPLGSTGESPTLSDEERDRVIAVAVREAKGRVPVIVGTGDNATSRAIAKAVRAEELGVDMVLVATPSYNRPTQEGLYRHIKAIAESVSIPLMLYNVPSRTGMNLEPETLARLAQLPSVIGLKESTGNISQATEMIQLTTMPGKPFSIFSGDDFMTLPLMALGATGVISVVSNLVPAEIVAIVRAIQENRWDEARRLHYRLWALLKVAFIETNPAPIKEAMAFFGMPAGGCRMPLCELKPESRAKLQAVLSQLDIRQPTRVR